MIFQGRSELPEDRPNPCFSLQCSPDFAVCGGYFRPVVWPKKYQ